MALVLKDRVKETSTTAGTGTLTLAGAVTGFQSFAAVGNGNTTYYAIADPITGDWEVGIGTYTSSGTTLSRTTVLSSSNGGSLVNFAANPKDVFVTYPSEKSVYEDASNVVNATSFGAITATSAALTTGTVSTTPASNTDIANKQYVDGLVTQGISYHTPVYVESPDTAGNLNATYNNGASGVGATLTNAGTQVALTIDGILMTVGKRVLIYNQTNAAQNGVYTVTTVGTASTNWVLTRATDANTYGLRDPNALGYNDAFFVTNGNTGAGETYVCTTTGTITFGTTAITFAQISSAQVYSAGTGLTLTGTQFSITPTGTAGTYGSASQVPVFVTNASGQVTSATNTNIAITGSQVSGNITGSAGSVANALTLGTYLTGTSYNGSAAVTAAVDATSVNTVSKVVARDASGNFSAGTITAALSGNATTATTATNTAGGAANQISYNTAAGTTSYIVAPTVAGTYLNWNGSAFAYSAISVPNSLTINNGGAGGASGSTFNGSAALTISYNTVGASPLAGSSSLTTTGTVTSGTWSASFGAVSGANLTSLTAGNLSGTIPSAVLGNSTHYVGTTAVALNRASANQALTGILSVAFPGSTSGTTTLQPSAIAGATTITMPATTGTMALTSDVPTVNNGTLTMGVSGTGLSGSATFTANQAGASTFTVTSNATNANTASTIVARDASGNFSAGTITATLSGQASSVANSHTAGTYLTGSAYNGSAAQTWAVDATSANTASKVVARDGSGNFSAGTITAAAFSGGTVAATTGSFSGQITSSVGGTGLSFTGAISNSILWNTSGVAAPTFTTRSVGTKLVLYPTLAVSSADYAFGIEGNVLWSGLPTTTESFKWYGGTTLAATLTGTGNLTAVGTVAGTNITTGGNVTGNAATATVLQTARTINGTSFNGSANITITANTTNTLTLGTYLTGTSFNGSAAVTAAVDATSANTASKVVARDASGNFSAGTITAALTGNASTATTATNQSGGTVNATTGAFSGNLTGTAALFSGQGRFGGWYTAGTGLALELGISASIGYIIAYNRTTSAYADVEINGVNIRLVPQGGTLTGPGGNIILHAGNYNSYAPTLTGTGASGTWSINVTGSAGSATTATNATNVAVTTSATASAFKVPFANTTASTTGNYGLLQDSEATFTYNPSTNTLTAGTFSGALSGNATTATTATNQSGGTVSATSGNFTSYLQVNGTGQVNLSNTGDITASRSGGTTGLYMFGGTATKYIYYNGTYYEVVGGGTNVTSLGVGTAPSGTTGEIRATNNITAYYSDDRLKTRLGKIENALDKIKTLDSFYYEANQTAQDLGYKPVREVGISAQQVQAIMPEVVAPAPIDDKYLTVRYERLVPLLLAAINELEAKVANLENRKKL